jgi:hypothetical protein
MQHASQAAYETWLASPDFITPNVSAITGSSSVLYNPTEQEHDYSKEYFTTVAKSDGTIGFSGSTTANTLSYSTDNGATWSTAAQKPSATTLTAGDKVLWKGECTPNSSAGIGKFTTEEESAQFDVEGNVMSLLYGDNFKEQTSLTGKDWAFHALFTANTKVISAENLSLPATTLANGCYSDMFKGCTILITAPELPATTLANSCYSQMFRDCTSLTTATALPATTLVYNCYGNMFNGCTGLTTAPALPATTLAENCYFSMFLNCRSLTTAPELPATTLATQCYEYMFYDCTSLNSITCLATNISANMCTYGWVSGVAATGTFKGC